MSRGSFRKAPSEGSVDPDKIQEDLMQALQQSLSELGTGGFDIEDIGMQLYGTFSALPKTKDGMLQYSAVRYLAHSFFLKEFGWLIRGLDPHRQNNLQLADDNTTRIVPDNYNDVPWFLVSLLEGQYKDQGLSLSRIVAYVATLGNLILAEGLMKLQTAYSLNDFKIDAYLGERDLEIVLDSFIIMLASDKAAHNSTEHWEERMRVHEMWEEGAESSYMEAFSGDVMRNMMWQTEHTENPFQERLYSFEDASQVMTTLYQQYPHARDVQCHQLKDGLVELDGRGTGRVSLTDFYERKAIGSWALNESPEYLRQLGVLDETAPSLGPQLIIPNYVTAVSNCDSPSEYYSICCIHECEELLNSLESQIEAPSASVQNILELVANLSSDTVEAPRNLSSALVDSLGSVASLHNGEIPLHSRLFAQWLHYAFPQECPYPHMRGKINPLTPSEWFEQKGRETEASESELVEMAESMKHKDGKDEIDVAEVSYMSQWTLEEEIRTSWPSSSAYDSESPRQGSTLRSMIRIVAFVLGPLSFMGGLLWSNKHILNILKILMFGSRDKLDRIV